MPRFKSTPQQKHLNKKNNQCNTEHEDSDLTDDHEEEKEYRKQRYERDGEESDDGDDYDKDNENDNSRNNIDCINLGNNKTSKLINKNLNNSKGLLSASQIELDKNKMNLCSKNNPLISTPTTLDALQTATILAQAVATVAAFTTGSMLPLFSSDHNDNNKNNNGNNNNQPPIAPLGLSLNKLSDMGSTKSVKKLDTAAVFTNNADINSENSVAESFQNQPDSHNTSNNNNNKTVDDNGNNDVSDDDDEDDDSDDDDEEEEEEEEDDNRSGNHEDDKNTSKHSNNNSSNSTQIKGRDKEKEVVSCIICNKQMKRGSIREHMDRHANSGRFECHVCLKNFSRASALEKHVRIHTGERPFKCEVCSKAYRQNIHLREHMRSHTGERPFLCRLCGFTLASKSLLNRHLGTHGINKDADEAANMWSKTDFSKNKNLNIAGQVGQELSKLTNINSNSNTNDRKYLCNLCPAGFPTVQALRSHRMNAHNLLTPHKCDSCPESFSSLKLLHSHLRKVHPHVCPICSKQMPERRRWMLEMHLRDEHPEASILELLGPAPVPNPSSRKRPPRSSTNKTNSPNKPRSRSKRPPTEIQKWKRFRPDQVHSSSSEEESDSSTTSSDYSDKEVPVKSYVDHNKSDNEEVNGGNEEKMKSQNDEHKERKVQQTEIKQKERKVDNKETTNSDVESYDHSLSIPIKSSNAP